MHFLLYHLTLESSKQNTANLQHREILREVRQVLENHPMILLKFGNSSATVFIPTTSMNFPSCTLLIKVSYSIFKIFIFQFER